MSNYLTFHQEKVSLQIIQSCVWRDVFLSGAVSGSERAVDDGGHHGRTKDQQGSLPLPVGTAEAPQ